MAKYWHRKRSSDQFDNDHRGFMSNMAHFFDFHQRSHTKKTVPIEKGDGGKRPDGLKMAKMELEVPVADESMDFGVDNSPVENKMKGSRTFGTLVKALLLREEMSKEKVREPQVPDFPSQLMPRNSLCELELEDHSLYSKSTSDSMSFTLDVESHDTGVSASRTFGTLVKALLAEEMSKEEVQEPQLPDFPSQLIPQNSLCELELEDHSLCSKSISDSVISTLDVDSHDTRVSTSSALNQLLPREQIVHDEPCEASNSNQSRHAMLDELRRQILEKHAILQEKLDEAKEAFLTHKFMEGEELSEDVTLHRSKEFMDALEMFNSNRELFLKLLQDPNSLLADHTASNEEKASSKPGFFYRAVSLGKSRAGVNKHRKETGSSGKHEGKLQVAGFSQDERINSLPLMDDDNVNGGLQMPARIVILKLGSQETAVIGSSSSVSSTGSSHEFKNRWERRRVANHFKGIKQRIKHVIKESRKERRRISMDRILHRIPYGHKASKDAEIDRDSPSFSTRSAGSASPRSWESLNSFERTSLGESPVRPSRWPESVLSSEAKRHLVERLKLAREDEGLHGRNDSKPFGRILSLPEFKTQEFYSPGSDAQSEVGSEVLDAGLTGNLVIEPENSDEQISVCAPTGTELCTKLDDFVGNISSEHLIEKNSGSLIDGTPVPVILEAEEDSPGGNLDDLIVKAKSSDPACEHESGPSKNNVTKLVQSIAVPDLWSDFQEDIADPAKISVSQAVTGSDSIPGWITFDEVDPSVRPKDQFDPDVPNGSLTSRTDLQMLPIPNQQAIFNSMHMQVNARDEADFTYVRNVLNASRFSNDEFLGTWHSTEQPVNPSLFDEVEGSPISCNIPKTELRSSCDHQLLFDCINEVLLEIYQRSFSDCPWIMFFNSRIRPMPIGYHVLEEVWATISWHLSSQSQRNPSLEHVVSRDLAKEDGWMDIRSDIECVGLELEDLILNDLLEEVLLSIGS